MIKSALGILVSLVISLYLAHDGGDKSSNNKLRA
jgi:hypothetical protein